MSDNLRDRIADIIECVGDDWDAQLIKACTETDGTPHPHTDHVLTGAKWQREQLRTPEAIERMARVMFEDDNGETIDDHLNVCLRPKECPPVESYRRQAMLIINALLGED